MQRSRMRMGRGTKCPPGATTFFLSASAVPSSEEGRDPFGGNVVKLAVEHEHGDVHPRKRQRIGLWRKPKNRPAT